MLSITKKDHRILMASVLIVSLFASLFYTDYARSESVTLTLTVQSTLSFSTVSANFGNVSVDTNSFATTTLQVTTNNAGGWNITLSGNDQGPSDSVCDLDSDDSTNITDQLEWIPNAATTGAGNAVRIASLDNSEDVLAFRVMTASGSVSFRASTWWGSQDAYVDNANTLWAGIASSTVARQIGNAGNGSYQSATHFNDVLYYLEVPSTQETGAYGCPLTYTATAN